MAKPYNFTALVERIKGLFNQPENTYIENATSTFHKVSLEEKISKIFINVGIPPHIKGYSFLREGVKMAVEDPDIINNITKRLYPSIGEKFGTTPSKVERAIRHAIEVAWNRGKIENINNLFGIKVYSSNEKPTNGEFIALVADKMLIEGA
jgi:two-component system response regulator (stage 0 sporulation protein A)